MVNEEKSFFSLLRDQTPLFVLKLKTVEDEFPELENVSSFIYYFNMIYELNRLKYDENYFDKDISRQYYYRNGRGVGYSDKLHLAKISHQSPIEIVTIATATGAAIAAILSTVKIVSMIGNFKLGRENLKLQNEKLQLEIENLKKTAEHKHLDIPIDWYHKSPSRNDIDQYIHIAERNYTKININLDDYSLNYQTKVEIIETKQLTVQHKSITN
ncbi:MAG: hypothetical protein HGB12_12050 [Bacteroidetes bacterium]|nr:hypothetical protein [Bacteroidota bacterium]